MEMVSELLFDQSGAAWTAENRAVLRSETLKLTTVVETTFGLHCTPVLFILQFYLLDHVVENLERFESFSFTNEAPFMHLSVLRK